MSADEKREVLLRLGWSVDLIDAMLATDSLPESGVESVTDLPHPEQLIDSGDVEIDHHQQGMLNGTMLEFTIS